MTSFTAPSELIKQLSVDQTKENEFASQSLPRGMGNTAQIAYGGNTTGVAVLAAYKTVSEHFFLFSMMGSFLGPARIDRKLHCRVSNTRDTKTFATRRVVVYQIQNDGSERACADVLLDFHIRENGMFEYSAAPPSQYFSDPEDPSKTAAFADVADSFLKEGKISRQVFKAWSTTFGMYRTFFEARQCLDSVSGQNLYGLAKSAETTQDHLPIPQKSAAEWLRTRQPVQNNPERSAALTFAMDGALSFLPLTLDHKDLGDAGACSTLDFALRILVPEVKMDAWHLCERRTIAAHGGRTYSEARMWDQTGRMVAVMTQTCICRPPAQKKNTSTKL